MLEIRLQDYDFLFGPVLALAVVGILALLLRWAFGHGGSLVAKQGKRGTPEEYGLLVAVSAPGTFVEAEVQRRTLEDAGLRATVAPTTDGPRVMVFATDERTARRILAGA
ncbi:hypothetical protein EV189_2517 [Motilibacter rhizosphaerae]|uniref:Uncharacterized protein n=1 Tax=Motilibacter rhizosphaerae TaxID=598652 RepID=A0A4Q7NPA0_9ACTN|nr:hypothetical protein [Motilibacter rhizosphaerae]RZS87095.1 hypothetical protein EV189_2517 [Motilibacter rhizosphaerae]